MKMYNLFINQFNKRSGGKNRSPPCKKLCWVLCTTDDKDIDIDHMTIISWSIFFSLLVLLSTYQPQVA